MGLLNWLRSRFPPLPPNPEDIQDPALGRLRYVDAWLGGVAVEFWQSVRAEIDGKRVTISIGGDRSGPDNQLRTQVLSFIERFAEHRRQIADALMSVADPPPPNLSFMPEQIILVDRRDGNAPEIDVWVSVPHPQFGTYQATFKDETVKSASEIVSA